VFSLIKPSRKLIEQIYSEARKIITISSHQELLKYRDLLATLAGSHLGVQKTQALVDKNLAEFCIRKKLSILPTEIQERFLRASSQWEEFEQGVKLVGPQTIRFSTLVPIEDKLIVDPNENVLGIVEGVSQAKNGTILLSVLTKIPTSAEFNEQLKTWVAKRNPEKKIAKHLKISQADALTLQNIMRYRLMQGHFQNLAAFNRFREEVFQPITVPFKGVIQIEEARIVYGVTQNEAKLVDTPGSADISADSPDEEVFYSFAEVLDED